MFLYINISFELFDWLINGLILIWFFLIVIRPKILFSNSYKAGDLIFYYNNPEKYGIQTEEQMNSFFKFCDVIAEETLKNPFYCRKKIKIYLCNSYGLFAFFNPFAVNVKGHCLTIFNYTRIVITKTDLTKFFITSHAKKNNQSNLKPALIHELTHSYRTKTMTLLLILFRSVWKEEGICEVVAVHSSYNVENGIKRLVSNNPDKGMAWKYFTYRMCVLYLMKHESLSFDEVLKDKRKQKEIMNQLYKMTESGLKALLE